MGSESTLVLVKPDGVNRGIIGDVISRLESSGLKISGLKLIQMDSELAGKHYQEHKEKPFFGSLIEFITSSPVVAIVITGNDAIQKTRTLMGSTNPLESAPGTIRGDLGLTVEKNIIHGSANSEDAKREISLYFENDEIIEYSRTIDKWIE
ncbi:MAG: nucleoside-diphosphate kinase [Chloroflexi bacterium]|nr:nucleoside-diphosphate kinase [Chloroflexota bacterium]|tara:strand:+ start:3354 stop:3806 length:453 start_codon:yes stop_codon:yes gene_type:complete